MSLFSFNYLKEQLKKMDWWLVIIPFLLVGLGIISIYSSSLGRGDFSNAWKQAIFLGIGLVLMFGISFFNWRTFSNNPYLILLLYFFGVLALIGLYFFAPEIRGIRGWYRIGPFSLDPVQFFKIILIVLLAKYFSQRHIEMYKFQHIILSGIYVFIPSALIFFQPDAGSASILIIIWAGILLISGIKIRHFVILSLTALLVFTFSWTFVFRDYQKARIISFINPYVDVLGEGWSRAQTRIAIGQGEILGQGIGQGSQTQYGFLPEPQTDFIFASIAEEMGLLGVSILLFLYIFLGWRIIKIATLTSVNFCRFFAFGFIILIGSQAFINIGMNLGLLPIVGLSLPFISYGGSSLISLFIGLGILQSIRKN